MAYIFVLNGAQIICFMQTPFVHTWNISIGTKNVLYGAIVIFPAMDTSSVENMLKVTFGTNIVFHGGVPCEHHLFTHGTHPCELKMFHGSAP